MLPKKNLIYKLGRILELVSKETNFNTPLFPFKIKKAGVPMSIWTWEHVHRPNPRQVLAATLTLSQPGGRGADEACAILVSTPSFESHRSAWSGL